MKLIGNLSPDLTPAHKTALEANMSLKIKEINKESLIEPLATLLGECCELLGQKSNGLTPTAKLLRDELKTYFTTYSLEEVKVAAKMGVTGKLCDLNELTVPVVSVTNICKFIHFYNDKVRKFALHEQRLWEEKNNQEEIERKRIEGNRLLDLEIEGCRINYTSDPASLNLIDRDLRACYYRRLRETGSKLDLELMNQLKAVAEAQINTLEELPKDQQRAYRTPSEIEKFNNIRNTEVKHTAQSLALKEIFDRKL